MRAVLECLDGIEGMPVIRRGDDNDVGILLLEQCAEVPGTSVASRRTRL